MKPKGKSVADVAIDAVKASRNAETRISYDQMDCQAFVEYCVAKSGGNMDYSGTNAMARAMDVIPLSGNENLLQPGVLLLIKEPDESGLPDKYAGDGVGDFSHVGIYIGPDAVEDTDKNGEKRWCDVAHSSATMGRVAGSTLKNGWTHLAFAPEIAYSGDESGISDAAPENTPDDFGGLTPGDIQIKANVYATVSTPDKKPVNLRKSPSLSEGMYWQVANNARVQVEKRAGDWTLVRAICTDGYVRRAYMMDRFLVY